ncbi:hypothetical protein BPAE_0327g00070 [Botrytis paeoniae]|uniref:Uncharacterized protein n=1 Tax=Botrytis paeoniae TaxID=278948 RepID=A0A4Z1FB85_9HELO|nr:hypothetical protein BPAE_0327g00070 [Botrytis paeoniae]
MNAHTYPSVNYRVLAPSVSPNLNSCTRARYPSAALLSAGPTLHSSSRVLALLISLPPRTYRNFKRRFVGVAGEELLKILISRT